jgi:anaerobic sulfite reductase subunit B
LHSILFSGELLHWKNAAHFHAIYTLDTEKAQGWRTGLVTSFLKEIPFPSFGDNYECIVVGPPAMMKFTGLGLLANGVQEKKIWMSFERKMSCAIGKCGHCRIDETYVCLDGPVFNYTRGKKLVD